MSTLSLFDRPEEPQFLRVAQVNRLARAALEGTLGDVWIEAEIVDCKKPASGHVYFTLQDSEEPGLLRGVVYRSDVRSIKAKLEAGAKVRVRGRVTLYEPRGEYQLIARAIVPAGAGDKKAEFERIRKKLEAEGLLDPEKKRKLPYFPKIVGVVTSASGAAIHDIIRVASHRAPVRIVISPCQVQGEWAPVSIVAALSALERLPGLDVVIVGRGGGGKDDLDAFNDERVARAIAACRVPIVSAVGHETDTTLADLTADVRAATPSNAAEIVVPDLAALARQLGAFRGALARAMRLRLHRDRLAVTRTWSRVEDPKRALGDRRRVIDRARHRMQIALANQKKLARAELQELVRRLWLQHPQHKIARDRSDFQKLSVQLAHAADMHLDPHRRRLATAAARLHALSPLAVLSRGYAIVLHEKTGVAMTRADQAREGDRLQIRLSDGTIRAKVEKE